MVPDFDHPHSLPSSPLDGSVPPKKRAGAPKAKGSVRAKSGCYTCRIRRKKCDEQPDERGACATCVRLRLQCLGFGSKRPEWLKENNNVTVFREKIKDFLAAQGMIKGHSGANNGRGDEAQQILVLVPDHVRGRTSSSSPPTTPSSADDDPHHHHPRPPRMSDVRQDMSAVSAPPAAPAAYHSLHMPPASQPVHHHHHHHPYGASLHTTYSVLSMSQPPSQATVYPPTVPIVPSQAYPSALASAQIAQMPAQFASTLPSSYQYSFDPSEHDQYPQEEIPPEWAVTPSLSTNVFPQVSDSQNLLVQHYLAHVLRRQYLLADDSIQSFIVLTIQRSPAVRDAACLLASLHQQSLRRKSYPSQTVLALPSANNEDDSTYARICLTLQKQRPGGFYTEEEALTGLLVVSAFLFRGGRGAWAQFLNVATEWVAAMLSMADDPANVLMGVSPSQRFIIKTTFWFDILAATTRGEPPRFLQAYRLLWGLNARGAFIGPMQSGGGTRQELSMLDVMGADNATALALAETAELAAWKERRARGGTLSVPDLVDRARRIEQDYLAQPSPTIPAAKLYGAPEDDLSVRRRLTANIFRATAKVYLHAVVSGDYPHVPEIRAGVREALTCLQQVPASRTALSSSVLRSVVFGICLTGCLTDEWEERQIVLQRLEEEQEEGVGNCAEARRVMECVWRRRAEMREGAPPVCWREVVHELGGGESLLLV
ncbi:fungal-specific transcription factor domain-containing protein [Vararia minispora EC-137]|uniref:Fungal-specific transcription factor domain-containing protein n=1 Tax=Vararia minispora EC-137 TaxID=1314806 RepID=A0ACB8Q6H2_9AGAM|nr:fungal-specific transcription factor domain-containing protein [Vararia minispora EC-137]